MTDIFSVTLNAFSASRYFFVNGDISFQTCLFLLYFSASVEVYLGLRIMIIITTVVRFTLLPIFLIRCRCLFLLSGLWLGFRFLIISFLSLSLPPAPWILVVLSLFLDVLPLTLNTLTRVALGVCTVWIWL